MKQQDKYSNLRRALRVYHRNKEALDAIMPPNLIVCAQLIRTLVATYAIEEVIRNASTETIEYIQMKYWDKEGKNQGLIASKFNMSESSIKRKDEALMLEIIQEIERMIF